MTVRIGLVGFGVMGTVHWNSYKDIPDAQVAAVCDIRPERLAGELGADGNIDMQKSGVISLTGVQTYQKFALMLREAEIDMVDLCVPTDLHARMAIAAMRAGKHVFCEKPMAIRSSLAKQMAETARETGMRLMIGHCLRFWPEYLMLKDMVDSRRYGAVRSVLLIRRTGRPGWSTSNWYSNSRRSGSAALDLHIHDVDTLLWMLGRPAKVSASGAMSADGGVEHITTLYQYDNGPAVAAEGAWDYPGPYPFDMAMTIAFERATAEFRLSSSPTLRVFVSGADQPETPVVPEANAYTEELRYFVDCVRANHAPTRVTPEEAAAAVAIVEAEIRSVRSGRMVKA